MASNTVKLEAGELARNITISVKINGMWLFLARIKIALLLFRLGTYVAGMKYKLVVLEDEDGTESIRHHE